MTLTNQTPSSSYVRRYSELILLKSFEERFLYLRLQNGKIGADTFGYLRWINQQFYTSTEYRQLRHKLICRDFGGDMGLKDYPIAGNIILHHMNPITVDDIVNHTDFAWNPEYIICVSLDTHNAIHFGNDPKYSRDFAARSPNDTCPWKRT